MVLLKKMFKMTLSYLSTSKQVLLSYTLNFKRPQQLLIAKIKHKAETHRHLG